MVTPYQTAEQSITSTNNIPPAINNNRPTLPIMLRPDAASSDDFTTSCDDNIIRTYTARDVLNGRGQGVQRHPGNVKYRTLVFVNKTLYAKCPRNDKIKISRGIVAAVRQFGGRFLDLDERTNIYTDIGDKKATEKTSQALREGQTKIRQDAYKNKDTGMQPTLPPPPISPDGKWEISGEGYVEYSVKVLHELYKAEDNMTPEMAARPAPHSVATQLGLGVQKRKEHNRSKGGGRIVSSDNNTMPVLPPIVSTPAGVSSAHMAAVYDQFDGMVPVQSQQQQQQQATTHPNMPPNLPRPAVPSSGSPMRETMSSQVTDISRLSLSEILRLTANGERGTTDPFTNQLVELVRQSNSELMQSGLGRDSSIRFTGRGDEILPNKEDDDAAARPSESTTNSSLMQRDTVLSFAPYDEYSTPSTSAQSGQQQQQQQESARMSSDRMSVMSVDNNDEANDVAEMLIRLSRDSEKKSGGAAMMEI